MDLILEKLTKLESGNDEQKLIVKSALEAQEKVHAELVAFRNEASERFDHVRNEFKI